MSAASLHRDESRRISSNLRKQSPAVRLKVREPSAPCPAKRCTDSRSTAEVGRLVDLVSVRSTFGRGARRNTSQDLVTYEITPFLIARADSD